MIERGFVADRVIVSVLARGGSIEIQITLCHSRSAQKIADRFDAFLIKCSARFGSDSRNHFDAERRDRLISGDELNSYAHNLAAAVTEALHYFIGHGSASPSGPARYLAAEGAHITHMLRDAVEDNELGYFNIPREYLRAHGLSALDMDSRAYREWVRSRVQLARSYFLTGRAYLSRVESLRCRLAGYAYTARFETVLESNTKFFANHAAWGDAWKRAKMETIVMLLKGAIEASGKVGLMLNVHKNDLENVLAVLPQYREAELKGCSAPLVPPPRGSSPAKAGAAS